MINAGWRMLFYVLRSLLPDPIFLRILLEILLSIRTQDLVLSKQLFNFGTDLSLCWVNIRLRFREIVNSIWIFTCDL